MTFRFPQVLTFCALLTAALSSHAALITSTLGNSSPGFSDGATPALVPDLLAAQVGQPAPFDAGRGNDLFANLSESWTFSYTPIVDPILSATLALGIADHDSAANGSQLANFSADGNDLTVDLDALFEAGGGAPDGRYNVYTVDLAGLLGSLADGSLTVDLALQGPGLQTALIGGGVSETGANGAFLIYSQLNIVTDDGGSPPGVPVPATLPIILFGLAALAVHRRRYSARAADSRA